ncbi:MAG: transglutaminase family protein [Planctomycetaceae bacterium]
MTASIVGVRFWRICCGLLWGGLLLPTFAWGDGPTSSADSPDATTPLVEPSDVVDKPSTDETAATLVLADPATVRKLVETAQKSVVVITFSGRDGKRQGLGSGFVLRDDGLIATNLHVIGEARPISVRLFDGRTFDVVSVYATDKSQDLAILKIDATGLPALPLGKVDELGKAEPLVAIGNPQGLEHSAVTGMSSIRKNVSGMDMIQLAMPIERGNSGGPVLNLKGEVVGLVTLKSLEKENIGFAVVAERLQPLLEKPNPVAMQQWLTIGVINPRLWDAPQGTVRWTQRAGRIHATGTEAAPGGRSFCLSKRPTPQVPFEVGVAVSFEEADGAAGLVFQADGKERHYGFYPSSGRLRLSRFDGPTVYSWNVLDEVRSTAFRPGEVNYLKVRIEADRFLCYCNDQLIFTSTDNTLTKGSVGLVKFRQTEAEFRQFQVGESVGPQRPEGEILARIRAQIDTLPRSGATPDSVVNDLAELDSASTRIALQEQVRELERQTQQLRELTKSVHARTIHRRLADVMNPKEGEVNLLEAALLLSALDNEDLDITLYQEQIDAMAKEVSEKFPAKSSEAERFQMLQEYLFEQQGFHGSRTNYYAASNSYLNEVIDDREGLPITLSVLYMEMARRCGFNVVGIGLPSHFIVQYRPAEGTPQLIDPFERGATLTEDDAKALVIRNRGLDWDDSFLAPQSPAAIIERMLRNLLGVANSTGDTAAGLRYVEAVLVVNPKSATDRLYKAVLCLNTGRYDEGIAEVDWVIEHEPEEIVLERVHELREALESQKRDSRSAQGP